MCNFRLRAALAALLVSSTLASAADFTGVVRLSGVPVPGASVIARQGAREITTVTSESGTYTFTGLDESPWTLRVEMLGFEPVTREFTSAPEPVELKLLPLDQIKTAAPPPPAPAPAAPALTAARRGRGRPAPQPPGQQPAFRRAEGTATANAMPAAPAESDAAPPNPNDTAADAFAIGGSVNNGAASAFSQAGSFGNARRGRASMYNGALGANIGDSVFDANSYSLTGQATPKPDYNRMQLSFNLGGPLTIPRLMTGQGASFFVGYQRVRNRNAAMGSALMPTEAQRAGQGMAASLISPQSQALLRLFPLPNFTGSTRFNYQIPLVGSVHQDSVQARVNKSVNRSNQLAGDYGSQSTRSDTTSIFGFVDTTRTFGINTSVGWTHRYTTRSFANLRYTFSRLSSTATPYFSGRTDIAGSAGISGTSRDPRDWGAPNIEFASGIASLTSSRYSVSHDQTGIIAYDYFWMRSPHNLNWGGDYRRQQFNLFSQQDPRGSFVFTGDFNSFLRGTPDTASIALGNPDKYLRANGMDLYFKDDWRVTPGLTLNLGLRWEYSSPVSERYGRLVNLDVSQNFAAVSPVLGSVPKGPLTGAQYPSALLRPDRSALQPRIGFAWRPMSGGSLVVRGGYGLYYDTSIYQPIALRMAQQAPLSRSFSIQSTPGNPLSLNNALLATVSGQVIATTFAVDPDLRIGYNHTWQLSVQRDLPHSLVFLGTYMGSYGNRGRQQFLPNTSPTGATGPAGFTYMTSNGTASRESVQFQLRRRLSKGFTSSLQYTWAKAIDNAILGGRNNGGGFVAQNWLNLRGERALSGFDQRHLVNFTVQYGTGLKFRNGWRGGLLRDWTFVSQVNAGTGLPLNPVFLRPTPGTGVTGSIRPSFTGAPLYAAPPGLNLNPAAFTAPAPGQWGNAGRNTITGPGQFSMNASMARTFRLSDRFSGDLRIEANNVLNRVVFPAWISVVNSAQFGLPPVANPMRTVQTSFRVRF